jgi:hypothetical protein
MPAAVEASAANPASDQHSPAFPEGATLRTRPRTGARFPAALLWPLASGHGMPRPCRSELGLPLAMRSISVTIGFRRPAFRHVQLVLLL